jgi:hypothetical protein
MTQEKKDIYKLIEEEDLTPDLQLMAAVIGIENVIKLIKELQGSSFYIPKITRLDNFIGKYLNMNRNKPVKLIARELGVTEMFLKKFRKQKLESGH